MRASQKAVWASAALLAAAGGQVGCGAPDDPWEPSSVAEPAELGLLGPGAVTITAGVEHSCAAMEDGTVACWGALSIGPNEWLITPEPKSLSYSGEVLRLEAGLSFNCLVDDSNSVFCWGVGESGVLGDSSAETVLDPQPVAALQGVALDLAAGYRHACALLEDGAVTCWGDNSFGQVGLGEADLDTAGLGPVEVLELAESVAAGPKHSCTSAGTVVSCWGDNSDGQVDPSLEAASHQKGEHDLPQAVVQLALGLDYTCALLEDRATLSCWGRGLQDGDQARSWSMQLQGGDVHQVVGGGRHICTLRSDGAAHCWGEDTSGQVGDGEPEQALVSEPIRVDGGPYASLAAGAAHTCAIDTQGRGWCWGANGRRQAGQF